MSAIKKFFEKKALEGKFKKAGQGQRLAGQKANPNKKSQQEAKSASKSNNKNDNEKSQHEMTEEKKMAAMAALNRLELKRENDNKGLTTHKGKTMKAELIAEQKEAEALARKYAVKKPLNFDSSKVVSGVFFTCPTLGLLQPLLKPCMEQEVEHFLISQLGEEPEMTSCLMIHTLNKNKQQIQTCLEILTKYLNNIIDNPQQISYRKIKASNRALNEKVLKCRGADEFLQAVGFERRVLDGEEYLIMNSEKEEGNKEKEGKKNDDDEKEDDLERLRDMLEVIQTSEPVPLQLHRDIKIFDLRSNNSHHHHNMQVPEEFYNIHPDELKREQKLREEAVKEMGMLVTKEMRERERLKSLRRYRYAVIRVRLPDGFMVQGTFHAWDVFWEVRMMLSDVMKETSAPFKLTSSLGGAIQDDQETLAELSLVPASLLMLTFEADDGGGSSSGGLGGSGLLKIEYLDQAEKI